MSRSNRLSLLSTLFNRDNINIENSIYVSYPRKKRIKYN